MYCERVSETEDDMRMASAGVSHVLYNYTCGSWTVLSNSV